jgi:hypothetical protein
MGSRAWTSGAFDPAAFTFSGASANTNSWAAVTLALRPENPQTGPFLIYQASAQNGATGNSLVINKPTGTRENDLLIACMNGSTNVTWIGDTGWTEVADQGTAPSTRVAYKIAGASEGASYTFTASSVSGTLSGTIATYRNAAYDAIGTIATGANPLVVGAVTATVDFSRILATVARDVGSITITGPATMQTIAIDNDATAPSRLVEEDINLSLSGSSGTRSFTVGNTVGVSGVLVSIKPAATYTPYAQYITRTTATAAAATSIAVNTSTCVPGNLLVLVVTYAFATLATDSLLTPSGWTLVSGTAPPGTAFYSPGMYVFYRIADGSEAASYTVSSTPGTTAGSYTAAMVTLAGINSSQIVAGATNSGSNTTSITATAVDARNNGILLYFGTQANDITAVTFTPPSGMTEAADIALSTASVDVTLEIAYQEGLSEGSTGNKTATASSSAGSDNYRALLVTIGAL